jgi:hypothetical protein
MKYKIVSVLHIFYVIYLGYIQRNGDVSLRDSLEELWVCGLQM